MDASATAIRSERRPVENTLYILAHDVALLAIADFGLRISDWVVGIGVRETGSGGWRLLEWVLGLSTRQGFSVAESNAILRNEGYLIDSWEVFSDWRA